MGIFSKLVGGGVDTANVVSAAGTALDKLFTSKDEKLTHQEILARIEQDPQKWQADINLQEAQHRTLFVAGWRPFIGWVCGTGLGFVFVFNPIIQWVTGQPGPQMPTQAMMTLVVSLLGLAGYRTVEKIGGAAK